MAAVSIPVCNDGKTRTVIVSASADSSVRIWDRRQPGGESYQITCIWGGGEGGGRGDRGQEPRSRGDCGNTIRGCRTKKKGGSAISKVAITGGDILQGKVCNLV